MLLVDLPQYTGDLGTRCFLANVGSGDEMKNFHGVCPWEVFDAKIKCDSLFGQYAEWITLFYQCNNNGYRVLPCGILHWTI